MRTITIESNGRLERTAIYVNGEQVAGVRELLISIDEEGTFHSIISLISGSGIQVTKQLFTDDISQLQRKEAAFTSEESFQLQSFSIESDGDLEQTSLFMNDDFVVGVVSIIIHIRIETSQPTKSLFSWFTKHRNVHENVFQTEIVFRNPNGTHSVESIF